METYKMTSREKDIKIYSEEDITEVSELFDNLNVEILEILLYLKHNLVFQEDMKKMTFNELYLFIKFKINEICSGSYLVIENEGYENRYYEKEEYYQEILFYLIDSDYEYETINLLCEGIVYYINLFLKQFGKDYTFKFEDYPGTRICFYLGGDGYRYISKK